MHRVTSVLHQCHATEAEADVKASSLAIHVELAVVDVLARRHADDGSTWTCGDRGRSALRLGGAFHGGEDDAAMTANENTTPA